MVYYEQENCRKDGQYHEKNHRLCSSRLFVCRDHDASGDTGAGERAPSVAALVDPLLSGDSGNQRAGRCLDQAGKAGSCNCTVKSKEYADRGLRLPGFLWKSSPPGYDVETDDRRLQAK